MSSRPSPESSAPEPGEPEPAQLPDGEPVVVRRSPKFAPFMVLGALLGLLAAAAFVYLGPPPDQLYQDSPAEHMRISRASAFGFFGVLFALAGLLLGALLVLILDTLSTKQSAHYRLKAIKESNTDSAAGTDEGDSAQSDSDQR